MGFNDSDLGWPLTHFQGQIGHCKTCYNNTIWIKHHINAKTVHLVHPGNISLVSMTVILVDLWLILRSNRSLQDLLQQYHLDQTSHQCQNSTFRASWQYLKYFNFHKAVWIYIKLATYIVLNISVHTLELYVPILIRYLQF